MLRRGCDEDSVATGWLKPHAGICSSATLQRHSLVAAFSAAGALPQSVAGRFGGLRLSWSKVAVLCRFASLREMVAWIELRRDGRPAYMPLNDDGGVL